jgi:aryl-alcohol dehydrogenase-like predicted oxidoreductase
MLPISRRNFLKTGAVTGALAGFGRLPVFAERGSAADWVPLGKSGVKVTRLAFGTGTNGGRVQQELGQETFTRLVRHAYDNGIRFFETSESYGQSQQMLGTALKGIPRDSYKLMTKVTTTPDIDMPAKIDELRRNSDTEYFDVFLLHYQHDGQWPEESARWQDAVLAAQERKMILTHGASVHGLPALRRVPGNKWLEVAMIRMNHKGTRMDAEIADSDTPGDVPEVVKHVHEAHAAGLGVISMKLVGEGRFTDRSDRQAAMRFAFRNAGVDAVTVGYKNTAEIDEAIANLNLALA